MNVEDNKLAIITEPNFIHFHLPKYFDNNLKHEIDSIIKHKGFLPENTMKNDISQLLFKYKHVNNIHQHAKKQNE